MVNDDHDDRMHLKLFRSTMKTCYVLLTLGRLKSKGLEGYGMYEQYANHVG